MDRTGPPSSRISQSNMRHTSGDEAPLLGLVRAIDEAHELRHNVAVVVGRPEGVVCHRPAWWKHHKVCCCSACRQQSVLRSGCPAVKKARARPAGGKLQPFLIGMAYCVAEGHAWDV